MAISSSGKTDGASSSGVDPAGGSSPSESWDAVLQGGIADTGIDPNGSFDDTPADVGSDPQGATPQAVDGSSAATQAATPPTGAGDGGTTSEPKAASTAPASSPSASPTTDPKSLPDSDALAGAQPFTFDVDGQARTIDGAFRIPGEGLYVSEDQVAHFQTLAAQAARVDTLEPLSREAQTLKDQIAEWDRIASYEVRNDKGESKTFTGRTGLLAMRTDLARSQAATAELVKVLDDPVRLMKLIDPQQQADGTWTVGWNQDLREAMRATVQAAIAQAGISVPARLQALAAPPPPPPAQPADFAQATVKQLTTAHAITGLTDADAAFLQTEFPRYVVTQADKSLAVDPRFVDVMKDRAALRAEQKKVALDAEKAGKFNAGMNGARATAPAPTVRPSTPTPLARPEKIGKAQAWDDVLQSALPDVLQTLGT